MIKRKLLRNIDEPTIQELKVKYNSLHRKYDFSLYLLYFGNCNMLSFLSGTIANIPVSILVGLATFTVKRTSLGIAFVAIMFSLLVITFLLAILAIKLTLSVIEIRDKSNNIVYKEGRNNKKLEMCFDKLNDTYRCTMIFSILAFVSVVGFVSMFIFANMSS